MRILLVEDNVDLNELLRDELGTSYAVDAAYTAKEANQLIDINPYDVVVLDIGLPDGSGVDVCQGLRSKGYTMPVLMLTGRSDLAEKVEALNSGADDYVTKPFEGEELLARIRALLRRTSNSFTHVELTAGQLVLNPNSRSVTHFGKPVALRRKEFDVLEFLLRSQPNVVTREMLLEHVWDQNANSFTNAIDVHISRLREAVDRPFGTNLIETVHGLGYRIAPHSQVDSPSPVMQTVKLTLAKKGGIDG